MMMMMHDDVAFCCLVNHKRNEQQQLLTRNKDKTTNTPVSRTTTTPYLQTSSNFLYFHEKPANIQFRWARVQDILTAPLFPHMIKNFSYANFSFERLKFSLKIAFLFYLDNFIIK